jgi:hypothetical protein
MGKKNRKRIFYFFIFSKKIILYQATCPPAKLSVLRAWFWPWESWEKKKKNERIFNF